MPQTRCSGTPGLSAQTWTLGFLEDGGRRVLGDADLADALSTSCDGDRVQAWTWLSTVMSNPALLRSRPGKVVYLELLRMEQSLTCEPPLTAAACRLLCRMKTRYSPATARCTSVPGLAFACAIAKMLTRLDSCASSSHGGDPDLPRVAPMLNVFSSKENPSRPKLWSRLPAARRAAPRRARALRIGAGPPTPGAAEWCAHGRALPLAVAS